MPQAMPQVKMFVSYAHADFVPPPGGYKESRAAQILNDIKYGLNCHSARSRFKILRDAEQLLHASNSIHETLDKAIDECDMALLLLSENYCASEECAREFTRLLRLRKPLFLVEMEDVWSQSATYLEEYRREVREILASHFWGIVDGKKVRYG